MRPGYRAGAGASTGPGFLRARGGGERAGQGAWGSAARRPQAVMTASAQGQVAAIFSRRRRAPRGDLHYISTVQNRPDRVQALLDNRSQPRK